MSLKEIKKNRLSPAEKWLLERIDGVVPKTNVYWYKDGKCILKQKFNRGLLRVSLCNIFLRLNKEFGLNYYESSELLAKVLCDYTYNGKLKVTL